MPRQEPPVTDEKRQIPGTQEAASGPIPTHTMGRWVSVGGRPSSLALELVALDDPRAQTSHEPHGRRSVRFQKTWAASAPRGRRPRISARSEADWMCRYILGSLRPSSKAQRGRTSVMPDEEIMNTPILVVPSNS